MKNPSRLILPLSLGVILLAGCSVLPQPQADTVRYFTLGEPVATAPVANHVTVRSVELAPHLRGRQMAVRVAANEVAYLEEVNWAAPLDEAIRALLRARLSSVGGGASVTVQVQRCELVLTAEGNAVQLSAVYTITPANGEPAEVRRGVYVAPPLAWRGKDHASLVGLISQSLQGLADAIAAAVANNP